ncbi:MAG: putative Na+/H+ antiporter [Gammaproteobacteria bacterium]
MHPLFLLCLLLVFGIGAVHGAAPDTAEAAFPRALDSYADGEMESVPSILNNRVRQDPFNLVATLIFFCAIAHTFLASKIAAIGKKWENAHREKIDRKEVPSYSVSHRAQLFHFLGEVEVIFGLWAIPLCLSIIIFFDRATMISYLSHDVNFTEPMFVVAIMVVAASRPILKLAEFLMQGIARTMGGSLSAWWLTILTIGPLLGSLITEPAAMTICALLLAKTLYDLDPSERFKYATLGLLFVNISVGGTLSHFAAPPVLMVAGPWDWGMTHMLINFGWKAALGIAISCALYYFVFRRELEQLDGLHRVRTLKAHLQRTLMRRVDMMLEIEKIGSVLRSELKVEENFERQLDTLTAEIRDRLEAEYMPQLVAQGVDPKLAKAAFDQRFEELRLLRLQQEIPRVLPAEQRPVFLDPKWDERDDEVPVWITAIHVVVLGWMVWNAHYPQLFVPGLLLFLGFTKISSPYQNRLDLLSPLLVGFFLGGLVIHGGVQGWWIAPVLGNLGEVPLMFVSTVLTAFNDNAAITYLSTLVPGFTDELKYAVVAGAVAGGGLTVIANAPNPAGQSLLKKYFANGVSAGKLLMASIAPTIIVWLCYFVFR